MDKNSEMIDDDSDDASQVEFVEAANRVGGWRRVVLLCAVLIGAMVLAYFLPIRARLQDPALDRRVILSAGLWIYPASLAIVAILVGCGVPRLLLCAVGGMVLGFWWGFAIVQAGSLLGYYAVFLFIRWGGRDWALRRWPAMRKWANLVQDHGVMGVILLRQLPIHGSFVNLGLGLSHVKHRHFLIGTAIGSLPEAIPATLAGAGLAKASIKTTAGYLGITLVALALIWIICGYILRAMRHSRTGSEVLAEAASLKGIAN
jgi:uncharacterized membrane protein YdjX (TVP38/TMEM64 family)